MVNKIVLISMFLLSRAENVKDNCIKSEIYSIPYNGSDTGSIYEEVKRLSYWRACSILVVSTDTNLLSQVKRELSGNLIENISCSSSDSIFVFCLFGWSGWGGDDMRKICVTKSCIKRKEINVYIEYPTFEYSEPIWGTDDMYFVGFYSPLGILSPGKYTVNFYGTYKHIKVNIVKHIHKEKIIKQNVLEKKVVLEIEE